MGRGSEIQAAPRQFVCFASWFSGQVLSSAWRADDRGIALLGEDGQVTVVSWRSLMAAWSDHDDFSEFIMAHHFRLPDRWCRTLLPRVKVIADGTLSLNNPQSVLGNGLVQPAQCRLPSSSSDCRTYVLRRFSFVWGPLSRTELMTSAPVSERSPGVSINRPNIRSHRFYTESDSREYNHETPL